MSHNIPPAIADYLTAEVAKAAHREQALADVLRAMRSRDYLASVVDVFDLVVELRRLADADLRAAIRQAVEVGLDVDVETEARCLADGEIAGICNRRLVDSTCPVHGRV